MLRLLNVSIAACVLGVALFTVVSALTVHPDPDLALIDQNGEAFSRNNITGKPHFLFFGFTSCGNICAPTLAKIVAAVRANSYDVGVLFVTTQPDNDTAEVLRRYLSGFSGDIVGVTGRIEDIATFAKKYDVNISLNQSSYNHPQSILLLDSSAKLVNYWDHSFGNLGKYLEKNRAILLTATK